MYTMSFSLPRARFLLFSALLVLAPFSKYPSVALPLFDFSSFRIGLYQLVVVGFVGLCAVPAWRWRHTFLNSWAGYGLLGLAGLGVASVSWSLYKGRSALLAASLTLLVSLVFAGWWYVAHELPNAAYVKIVRYMLIAGMVYGILGLVQFAVFTFSDATLGVQCRGCVADVFGFPRINGPAAEPQFFANALLPFLLVALYSVVNKPSRLAWSALGSVTIALGLTFSRGAYAALCVGLLFLGVVTFVRFRATFGALLRSYIVVAGCIILSIGLLVGSASIRFADTPHIAYNTLSSVVEHLSLGTVLLPDRRTATVPVDSGQNEEVFVSPGYIEASNEERTSAADLALQAWRSGLATAMLGVGLGNLGPFVVTHINPGAPSNLTVYIYYILVLAELGTVGLCCLLVAFGTALRSLLLRKRFGLQFLATLLVAFLAQYAFFGTYINAVYVWLYLGIALGISAAVAKSTPVRKKRV